MNATSGESFDTERDFADAERQFLQKLFICKEVASSAAEFRQKLRKMEQFRPHPEKPCHEKHQERA